jgi:hypothetical protein
MDLVDLKEFLPMAGLVALFVGAFCWAVSLPAGEVEQ